MKPRLRYSRCGTRVVPTNTVLAKQVLQYITDIRVSANAELDLFRDQATLTAAVEKAALAIGAGQNHDKRFSHQYRITPGAIAQARTILLGALPRLRSCHSFHQLHDLICQLVARARGLGELYCYDTALRIGAKLDLLPQKVYLHRGTREGARALGRNDYKAATIDPRTLPRELSQLEPHEIEDFLCIFKDCLHTPKRLTMDAANRLRR